MGRLFNLSLLTLSATPLLLNGAEPKKPNVVFIYADDLGRGILSHFGQKHFETPNIDQLFNKGTHFTNAYGCTYSAPSRGSMLSGYSDIREGGVWDVTSGGSNYNNVKCDEDFQQIEKRVNATRKKLPKDDLYLSQVFKRAGYTTAQIGKIGWGFLTTREQMKESEWDYYYGYMDHAHAHVFYPQYLFENDEIVTIEGNTHPTGGRGFEGESVENYKLRWDMTGKKHYSQDLFIDKALGFINDNKDVPFFLYHPTQLPHGPVAIPKVDDRVKNDPELTEIEKEYASMVLMLDDHVGRIVAELKELGIYDNTIIVFSVDNGHETYYTNGNNVRKSPIRDTEGRAFDVWDYYYTSERTGDKFDGNNGFSGKKWSSLEGGIRVPLAFCWEGHIPSNNETDQLVANYDLLTTFADMLDVKLNYAKDGVSLLPILFDGRATLPYKRHILVNSTDGPTVIDSDGWKLRYHKKLDSYKLVYLPNDYNEEHPIDNEEVFSRLKPFITPVQK